ncbi:hypothetical protein A5647_24190 [Mycobacterium sp. 1100029.7]|nr:hypothetical protein A5647_24190 [Mycobacterium sp. 1100029.7]
MAPTLSQLQAWQTDHLINAATYWTTTADRWEDTFTQVRNQATTMGWEGEGGEGLRARAGGDLATVSTKADLLRSAAQVARTGAGNISAAQRRALYAVEDAENAGFRVGEDLSVTDTRTSRSAAEQAARQAQAQAFAGDINQRAAQLLAVETETSGQLTSAAGDVGAMNFSGALGGAPLSGPHSGSPDDQIVNGPNPNGPHIRLVDNTTGPGDPSNPTPGAQPTPQIGPFPVPPQVAASAPPEPPRPVDPTGGLLTPQNLPPAPPPPNIPGVRPAPAPTPIGAAPMPSYPDLVNQVNSQGQVIRDMQNAQHNVTAGGLLGAGLAGCTTGGVAAALPSALFPPSELATVPGGCAAGAITGISGYLAAIWGANAFGGK